MRDAGGGGNRDARKYEIKGERASEKSDIVTRNGAVGVIKRERDTHLGGEEEGMRASEGGCKEERERERS